jgi:hypothetical protein
MHAVIYEEYVRFAAPIAQLVGCKLHNSGVMGLYPALGIMKQEAPIQHHYDILKQWFMKNMEVLLPQ